MSTPTEDLNLQIKRLKLIIGSKPGNEDFINALKSLEELAEKDLQQNWFLSLSRTKINWAPSLVNEIVDVLQGIKKAEDLDKELPKLIKICDQYKQKKDITYPWARILGILMLSTIGLLVGAAIGAILGAVSFATAPCFTFTMTLPSAEILTLLALIGAVVGAVSGASYGAFVGYTLGTRAVGAEFGELISTIFYQEEQQALNQLVDTLATNIEAVGEQAPRL